jgi:hypothetical protein
MNLGGWIMLIMMWGGVFALGIYCFQKIFSDKNDTEL